MSSSVPLSLPPSPPLFLPPSLPLFPLSPTFSPLTHSFPIFLQLNDGSKLRFHSELLSAQKYKEYIIFTIYACPDLLLDWSLFELYESVASKLLFIPVFREMVSILYLVFYILFLFILILFSFFLFFVFYSLFGVIFLSRRSVFYICTLNFSFIIFLHYFICRFFPYSFI